MVSTSNSVQAKIRKETIDLYRSTLRTRKKSNFNGTNKQVKNVTTEEDLVPPDGGWGWLVLLASVMVNLLIPGTVKSFGVLFVEFLEVF